MRSAALAMLCALAASLAPARADVAPFPARKRWRPPSPPVQTTDARIRLENADVGIHVAPGPARGFWPFRRARLCATVQAKFDLRCLAGPAEPAFYPFVFPVAPAGAAGLETSGFTVEADGAPVVSSAADAPLELGAPDPRPYTGYTWRAPVAQGRTVRVTVRYTLWLARAPDADGFRLPYVLRSGAAWDGPVGRETVRVTAAPGLALAAPESAGLAPNARGARELTWTLSDFEPSQDIAVLVTAAAP